MSELSIEALPTPSILLDRVRLQANVDAMQAVCTAHRVELRPHIKTHKMVEVGRVQLKAGAKGFTCAKLSEAEAMLPSGVRQIFVAHSLVDLRQAPRIAALSAALDDFRVGCTSAAHVAPLAALAAKSGLKLRVMMAVDSGLGREGARGQAAGVALAAAIARQPELELCGFYTHEGQLYGTPLAQETDKVTAVLDTLCAVRDAVDKKFPVWPGCSMSAAAMAKTGRPQAVRPGSYVFGDLSLTKVGGVVPAGSEAIHILTTVVDKPEPGLALIDAGSKTLSGDATPDGIRAISADGRDISVVRANEEHGYLRGKDVDSLKIGERIRLIPAHVCPVINLTSQVVLVEGDAVKARWNVEARGCVT